MATIAKERAVLVTSATPAHVGMIEQINGPLDGKRDNVEIKNGMIFCCRFEEVA